MSAIPDPPIRLSATDQVALLIGRLVMSWGLFDQRLYSQIILFESEKYMRNPIGDPPTLEQIIDYSFEKRIKRLRRLSHELSKGDPAIMARVDNVIRRLVELSLVRHHLAHGFARIVPRPGETPTVDVREHKEERKRQRRLIGKVLKQKYKPSGDDLNLSYTFEQISEAKSNMDRLYEEFSDVFSSVRTRCS